MPRAHQPPPYGYAPCPEPARVQSSDIVSRIRRTLFDRGYNGEDSTMIARPESDFPSPRFEDSIKYLAYGSNLSAETFLGFRGIKPLSQVGVRVPSLTLMFDLAGIPYLEPRFANVRPREDGDRELIGVVYEVTPKDYATILKTEGGYDVIDVACIPLTPVAGIDSFQSKTLIIPTQRTRTKHEGLPSLRYLTLILQGAKEHNLPRDYQSYLANTGYYKASTWRQRLGAISVAVPLIPIMLVLFILQNLLTPANGQAPAWLIAIQQRCFQATWASYDFLWRRVYGDGEDDRHEIKPSTVDPESLVLDPQRRPLLVKVEETMAANSTLY